jgi:hypothetical protein
MSCNIINLCNGITLKNERCKSHIKNKRYCRFHISQKPNLIFEEEDITFSSTKNFDVGEKEQCCVCFDERNFPKPLKPCNHLIHSSCVWKTGTDKCPLCRVTVKLTKKQILLMNIRNKKFKREMLEEEREELINQEIILEDLFVNENNLTEEELTREIMSIVEQYFGIVFMLENVPQSL